jgi:predicted RNA-binding Zn ribbon-like protein
VKPPNDVSVAYTGGIDPYSIDYVHPALDLVNSRHGRSPDLLEDAVWLDGFLAKWGYVGAGRPSAVERAKLIELRAVLRRLSDALARGESPGSAELAALGAALTGATLRRELEPDRLGLRLAPLRPDWRWVRSEVGASFVELVAAGELDRLKVCDNPDCRFAFYDVSKNRSRRWCAQATCGNRHKVQRFRERKRARLRRAAPPAENPSGPPSG